MPDLAYSTVLNDRSAKLQRVKQARLELAAAQAALELAEEELRATEKPALAAFTAWEASLGRMGAAGAYISQRAR